MVDVFEEVEEQLRSARYMTLVRKGWPYALALVVVVLIAFGGFWGYRAYQESQSAKASTAYAQAADALARNDLAAAEKGFTEVGASGPHTYRALALMQLAALRLDAGKTAEAVALFDQAADVASTPVIEDVARLKAAYALFDTTPLADLRKRLDPLAVAGRPYAALAREALAMKQLAAGDTAAARSALSVLSLLPDATEELRDRAQAAVILIDSGAAGAVPSVVAAEAALPPAPTPAPAAVGTAAPAANPQSSPAGAAQ